MKMQLQRFIIFDVQVHMLSFDDNNQFPRVALDGGYQFYNLASRLAGVYHRAHESKYATLREGFPISS